MNPSEPVTFTDLLRIINQLPDEAFKQVAEYALEIIRQHRKEV